MQINGMREFLSQFTPRLDQLGAKNTGNPFMIGPKNDSLDISEMGKRLSFRSEDVGLVKTNANTGGDPVLKLVNQGMTRMEEVLEKMKALTVAAQDVDLTELERIEMQIEMEALKKELQGIKHGMQQTYHDWQNTGKMGNLPPLSKVRAFKTPHCSTIFSNPGPPNNGYSLLERARDRILKGEKWDIREKFDTNPIPKHIEEHMEKMKELAEMYGSMGQTFFAEKNKNNMSFELAEVRIGNESFKADNGTLEDIHFEEGSMKLWVPADAIPQYVPYDDPLDPNDPYVQSFMGGTVRGRWVPTDDKSFLTVREKMEQSGTIILMDAKSAAKGAERLDKEIEALQKMREQFVAFCESRIQAEDKNSAEYDPVQMYMKVFQLFKKFADKLAEPLEHDVPSAFHSENVYYALVDGHIVAMGGATR